MSQLKLIATILLLIINNFSFSQFWFQQPSGTGWTLGSSHFLDANTGFIGADGGYFLRTTNGGNNWTLINTNTNSPIRSVHFINPNVGLLGTSNKVLRTTNGGINWDNTIIGGGNSISFVNSSTGYSLKELNRSVWKTTNAGLSWDSISSIVTNNFVRKIFFVNENTGYACGTIIISPFDYSVIWKSTDSGITWTIISNVIISPQYSTIFDLFFVNQSTGFALGNIISSSYFVYKTTNGGVNWAAQLMSNSQYSIFFIDVNTGWMCGANGTVYRTTNGGTNWIFGNLPNMNGENLNEVFFVNSMTGWVCGSGGRIFKSTNGGITAIEHVGTEIPKTYSLHQNFPNPFNPITQIKFDIPKSTHASLIVYDALGRKTAELVNERLSPGTYSYEWDASAFPSGVYFYKLIAGDFSQSRKMVLIK